MPSMPALLRPPRTPAAASRQTRKKSSSKNTHPRPPAPGRTTRPLPESEKP